VYSKLNFSIAILISSILAGTLSMAQTSPPPIAATPVQAGQTSGQATIRGTITDPSGALIPGTTVTVNGASGTAVATATADAAGGYEIHAAPGTYSVTASSAGFAPFVSANVTLAPGQVKRINIAMAIETAQQSVVVTDETPTVNVQADSNANSLIIKGKDLDALSDDPDELSSELTALAGPSAGPNGGQIYIDGFTGGQLPPKSSIREIRINQNPYSAEYDRLGFGRIEILTKPGTDKLHGQFFIMGNDSHFNTGIPFTTQIEPYYSYQYNGTLSGSLGKTASFSISAEHRSINNDAFYDVPCLVDGTSTVCNCPTSDPFCVNGTIPNPHSRTNISPRFDFQFGKKNTLTVRYQYYHDSESGDISPTQLPSLSFTTDTNDNNVQISDTEVISDHIVNETRFQYDRIISTNTPVSAAPTISVQVNGFSSGGDSSQNVRDHTDRWEMQNLTTMSLGKHAVKFGMRVRDGRDANFSDSGFNGSFTFQNTTDFVTAFQNNSSATPIQLNYAMGNKNLLANVFDGAVFVQDDWSFNPRLTLSGGLRWESQNHVADHNDWAPRISMAYALDGSKGKQAKTVLRAGYGIFYDRLPIGNFLTINRSIDQSVNTLADPVNVDDEDAICFNPDAFNPDNCTTNTPGVNNRATYSVAPGYHSPYTQQFGASIERQLTKVQTATLTYLHSVGDHQLVEINDNAQYKPVTGTSAGFDPAAGLQFQFLPEGVFRQDQLILNTNARFSPNFSVFGFYTLSFAHSDGAGGNPASNSFNLAQDYGRAGFVSRNQVFLIGNYTAKWGIRLNPFLQANSGRPYNVTIPGDPYGDSFFNHRPGVVNLSPDACVSPYVYEPGFGCLDPHPPLTGETLLRNNAGTGPAAVVVNLRISRAFGVGPKLTNANANQGQNQGGGPGGGPPGGGRGGPGGGGPGGGFGPGGFGGGGGRGGPGGMFGPAGTGRKYSLNFSVQALNMFNNINYGTPVGVVGDPHFGESRSLQGGLSSSGASARRIFLQATFSF
jgi:hypothetical protein